MSLSRIRRRYLDADMLIVGVLVWNDFAGVGVMVVIVFMWVAVHLVPMSMLVFVNELSRLGFL